MRQLRMELGMVQPDQADLLARGYDALHRYAWSEARDLLREAAAQHASGEAHYGLARAARWLHDEAGALEHGERAFEYFQREGAHGRAALAAIELALDLLDFRGQTAVANGWLERARRILGAAPPDQAHGWLAGVDAYLALMLHNDSARCIELADRAIEIAQQCGPLDIEVVSRAIKGLALVTAGEVERGMSLLDEASVAAIGPQVTDPTIRSTILCALMDACDRVRDFDRASQWSGRIQEATERWDMPEVLATCRPHYAVVLTWRGEWAEAEEQLNAAIATLSELRPPHVVEGIVRLAELRVRQGRLEEAAELFARVEHEGLAQLGRAALALEQDDAVLAYDLASRYVRRIPLDDRIERAPGLEMLAYAALACENLGAARDAASELRAIAERIPVGALRAAAALVSGLVAAAEGEAARARDWLEDAVDLYGHERAPFETARARVELGRVLAGLGMADTAAREWRRARAAFDTVGAPAASARVVALLEGRSQPTPAAPVPGAALAAGLSTREAEVLRLIAEGYSNREIAEELVLSVRTVERHVTNIYGKLDVSGRTARAAVTAHAYRLGLLASGS